MAGARRQDRITWEILATLAAVEDALGHAEEASGARAEGRRIVERIASTLADRALEDGFRNTPTVRSLFAGRAAEGRTAK